MGCLLNESNVNQQNVKKKEPWSFPIFR